MSKKVLETLESGRYILANDCPLPKDEHHWWSLFGDLTHIYSLEGEYIGHVDDTFFPNGAIYDIKGLRNAISLNRGIRYKSPDDRYYLIADCVLKVGNPNDPDDRETTIEATDCVYLPVPHWVESIEPREPYVGKSLFGDM